MLAASVLLTCIWGAGALAAAPAESSSAALPGTSVQKVYVVPVKQTIETGLERFLARAIAEAEEAGAAQIIFEIDTLGGRVDAAEGIGQRIRDSKVPTVAFVQGRAVSAGSYIALNAGRIVMKPGGSIGAAAVVDGSGTEVDNPKVVSHWASMMRAAAELRGRNPVIAEGMADKNTGVPLPEIGKTFEKGQIVSLTSEEALKVGYADHLADDLPGVLAYIGMSEAEIVPVDPTASERLARLLTHPVVMTLLLLVGIAGVAIELFVPGFGFPGILGVAAFALYFFGHYIAGFAGVEHMILFVIGIVLLIVEIFMPSFGILGIAGIASIVGGVIMAAYDTENALLSLGIAFGLSIVVVAIVIRIFRRRGIWNKFILREQLTSEQGFNSHEAKDDLLGVEGTALTPLRPSGTAMLQGKRVDVVTGGEFIASGQSIEVIQVEGTRVVVRKRETMP